MLSGVVNQMLIPPENALRLQASRMMLGLERSGPKPFSFRLTLIHLTLRGGALR